MEKITKAKCLTIFTLCFHQVPSINTYMNTDTLEGYSSNK